MNGSVWQHFEHGADVGIRGVGASRDDAFRMAARAMTAIVADPDTIASSVAVEIECEAPDDELLLVDWLNALIYEMATRRMLFGRFDVHCGHGALTATAWGEPVDIDRHQPAVEVKGATFTALKVGQEPDGRWIAQCVIDV